MYWFLLLFVLYFLSNDNKHLIMDLFEVFATFPKKCLLLPIIYLDFCFTFGISEFFVYSYTNILMTYDL